MRKRTNQKKKKQEQHKQQEENEKTNEAEKSRKRLTHKWLNALHMIPLMA